MAKRIYEKTLSQRDLGDLPLKTEMQHIFYGTPVISANEILWMSGGYEEIGFRLSPKKILVFQIRKIGEKTYLGTIDECKTVEEAVNAFKALDLAEKVDFENFLERLNRTMRNISEWY